MKDFENAFKVIQDVLIIFMGSKVTAVLELI